MDVVRSGIEHGGEQREDVEGPTSAQTVTRKQDRGDDKSSVGS